MIHKNRKITNNKKGNQS